MYFILLLTKDLEEHWSKTTINHFKATLQITVCSVAVMVRCHTVPAAKGIVTDNVSKPSQQGRVLWFCKKTMCIRRFISQRVNPVDGNVGDFASLFCPLCEQLSVNLM